MPDVDGIALVQEMRELDFGHHVHVVMTTGDGALRTHTAAPDAGADAFIPKPGALFLLRACICAANQRTTATSVQQTPRPVLHRTRRTSGAPVRPPTYPFGTAHISFFPSHFHRIPAKRTPANIRSVQGRRPSSGGPERIRWQRIRRAIRPVRTGQACKPRRPPASGHPWRD